MSISQCETQDQDVLPWELINPPHDALRAALAPVWAAFEDRPDLWLALAQVLEQAYALLGWEYASPSALREIWEEVDWELHGVPPYELDPAVDRARRAGCMRREWSHARENDPIPPAPVVRGSGVPPRPDMTAWRALVDAEPALSLAAKREAGRDSDSEDDWFIAMTLAEADCSQEYIAAVLWWNRIRRRQDGYPDKAPSSSVWLTASKAVAKASGARS